jgi:hypothetical protein
MWVGNARCEFREVSEQGNRLIATEGRVAVLAFCRALLACPRLRDCPAGDCCTIFAASLLADADRDG